MSLLGVTTALGLGALLGSHRRRKAEGVSLSDEMWKQHRADQGKASSKTPASRKRRAKGKRARQARKGNR